MSEAYRFRNYLTYKTKLKVYNAYFLPHFRYLLPVWGTCGVANFGNIQRLQNKTLKILFNYDQQTHTETLYRELGVFKLEDLRELEQCKLIYKIINQRQKSNTPLSFCNKNHDHKTRQHLNIYLSNITSNKGLHNPVYQAASAYNSLPDDLKHEARYQGFVRKLKKNICKKIV